MSLTSPLNFPKGSKGESRTSSVNHLYEFGPFRLDPAKRILKNKGELVPLNSKPLDLLLMLVEESGRTVEKDELMKRLWPDSFVEEGNLTVHVSALRKALGETPNDHHYILTIPGRGYRFAEPVRAVENGHEVLPREGDHPGKAKWLNARMGLAIALMAVAGIMAGFHFLPPARKPSIPPPSIIPITSFPGDEIHPAFSPDGNQLAYAWNGERGDNFDIYVQLIGAGGPVRLTNDPAPDYSPAWSPDGRYIAFIRHSDDGAGVFVIPAIGGHERKLAESHVTEVEGPLLAWSSDGRSLVTVDKTAADKPYSLFLLSIETGELKRLTFPDRTIEEDKKPAVSPDGKTVAFSRGAGCDFSGTQDIYLVPFSGGKPNRLTSENKPIQGLAWSANGRQIIFSSEGRLWRVGLPTGKPELLEEFGENIGFPSISRQGDRLAFSRWVLDSNIVQLDGMSTDYRPGQHIKPLIASTRADESPQYSPDGKKILFYSDRSGKGEFWICDNQGQNPFPIPSDGRVGAASWSPDGRLIAFDSLDEGRYQIYVMSAEGGIPHRLTTDSSNHILASWSHDGRWIYFGTGPTVDSQVWKIPSAGGQAIKMTQNGGTAAWESRDGKFLYYSKGPTSTAAGFWRMPVEGGEEVPIVPLRREPLPGYWALTEKGIYFVDDRSEKFTLTAPAVLKFFNFAAGRTREITPLENAPLGGQGLSVSPDGRWLLYEDDYMPSDIMLVEKFR